MIYYTSVFGNYNIKIPLHLKRYEVFVFSDRKRLLPSFVNQILVNSGNKFNQIIPNGLTGFELNRFLKYSSTLLFKNSKTIYFDSRVRLKKEFCKYVDDVDDKIEWMSPPHRYSNTIHEELLSCLDAKIITTKEWNQFKNTLFNKCYSEYFPENGLIYRNYTYNVAAINKKMIDVLSSGILRDQLYFHYFINQLNFSYLPYKFNERNNFYYLKRKPFALPKQIIRLIKRKIF